MRIKEKVAHLSQPELNKPLFHYTDTNGLIGILDKEEIWASHFRFLNDSSELLYARAIFDQVLAELIESGDYSDGQDFFREIDNLPHAFNEQSCYIICFSEEPDLLNQWRDYGSRGGYAIGFTGPIVRGILKNHYPNGQFFRVIYDENLLRQEYREMILDFMKHWLENSSTNNENDPPIQRNFRLMLSGLISWTSMFFKHPAFKIEKEWRFCIIDSDPGINKPPIDFRQGIFGLTPFAKCALVDEANKKIPINVIYVGPAIEPANAKLAVDLFLRKREYSSVRTENTTLPVRSR